MSTAQNNPVTASINNDEKSEVTLIAIRNAEREIRFYKAIFRSYAIDSRRILMVKRRKSIKGHTPY